MPADAIQRYNPQKLVFPIGENLQLLIKLAPGTTNELARFPKEVPLRMEEIVTGKESKTQSKPFQIDPATKRLRAHRALASTYAAFATAQAK